MRSILCAADAGAGDHDGEGASVLGGSDARPPPAERLRLGPKPS
jgi:hypothetical protein